MSDARTAIWKCRGQRIGARAAASFLNVSIVGLLFFEALVIAAPSGWHHMIGVGLPFGLIVGVVGGLLGGLTGLSASDTPLFAGIAGALIGAAASLVAGGPIDGWLALTTPVCSTVGAISGIIVGAIAIHMSIVTNLCDKLFTTAVIVFKRYGTAFFLSIARRYGKRPYQTSSEIVVVSAVLFSTLGGLATNALGFYLRDYYPATFPLQEKATRLYVGYSAGVLQGLWVGIFVASVLCLAAGLLQNRPSEP